MGPSELHHWVCCQKCEIILLMAPSTIPAGLLTCVGEDPEPVPHPPQLQR